MKSRTNDSGGLVYSTESGRMCPVCRRPIAQCVCAKAKAAAPAPSDGIVRGLALDSMSLAKLAQQRKAACGSGGTVKDGAIEVQGDHCDKVMALLKGQGHTVKRAGG